MLQLEKSKLKREALVNATIDLVNNNGFHATSMSKIAKMANVSPATIYLYFENKQDLVNKVYLEVKTSFTACAFRDYDVNAPIELEFQKIWKRIANFKLKECKEAMFLAQCDNTPIIDKVDKEACLKHLQPLLDLWERGKAEGLIKPLSPYLLYAYTINPLSFLMVMQKRGDFKLNKRHLEDAYQASWNSIKK